jgi:hypothetical protein
MPGRINLWVLLAVAALLANIQCYAVCIHSASDITTEHHSHGCHHTSHSKEGGSSHCSHQQWDSTSIASRSDLAQISAPLVPVFTLLFRGSLFPAESVGVVQRHLNLSERGSPPPQPLFVCFSVFRI